MKEYIQKKNTLARRKKIDSLVLGICAALVMSAAFGGLGGWMVYTYIDFWGCDKYQATVVELVTEKSETLSGIKSYHSRTRHCITYRKVYEFLYNGKLTRVPNISSERSEMRTDGDLTTIYYNPRTQWVLVTNDYFILFVGLIMVILALLTLAAIYRAVVRDT